MINSEIHAINAKIRALKSHMYEDENLNRLLTAKNVEEVAVNIFPEIIISDVGINIHTEFEIKLYNKAIKTFKKITKYSNNLKPFLVNLLSRFEISNLKKIVKGIIYPRFKSDTRFLDISPFSSFNPKEAIKCKSLNELSDFLSNTPYKNFITTELTTDKSNTAFLIENKLDIKYYKDLFNKSRMFFGKSKKAFIEFLSKQVSYINLSWILRLKYYYDLEIEDIKNYIILHPYFKFNTRNFEDMFEATYQDEILSSIPHTMQKQIENVYFENYNKEIDYENATFLEIDICIKKILKNLYISYMYRHYLTAVPIIAFIELKMIELSNLNSIIEGFRFNLKREEIKSMLI